MRIVKLAIFIMAISLLTPLAGLAAPCWDGNISFTKNSGSSSGWYLYDFTVNNTSTCSNYSIQQIYVIYNPDALVKNPGLDINSNPIPNLPTGWDGSGKFHDSVVAGSQQWGNDSNYQDGNNPLNSYNGNDYSTAWGPGSEIAAGSSLGGFLLELSIDINDPNITPNDFGYEIDFIDTVDLNNTQYITGTATQIASVPEPGTIILIGLGLMVLGLYGHLKRSYR